MSKLYKTYGIVNIFDVIPDFVLVVVERDGKFYFPYASNLSKVKYFHEAPRSIIKRIKPFSKFICSKIPDNELTVNSDFLFAFQVNEKDLQIGTSNELISFLSTYKTDDEALKEKIETFIKEVKDQA